MADQQLGGKPRYPAEKLSQPSAPDELEVMLDEQVGDPFGVAVLHRVRIGRKRRQDLIAQRVADLAGAGERPDLPVVIKATQQQRGQIQPCRPPLRALEQQLHAVAGQRDPLVLKQLGGLLHRERQVPAADLRECPPCPQSSETDLGVRARRCEQSCVRGQPLDRVPDRSQRSVAVDRVEVVEDDRGLTSVADEAVHQLVDHGPWTLDTPRTEERRIAISDPGAGKSPG